MEGKLRQALWAIAALIAIGTPAELALTAHWGDPPQIIPFVLSALALLAIGAAVARPSATTVKGARYTMVFIGLGAIFGVWEHLEHNAAFAMEIDSSIGGAALVTEAVFGANPLLAPGIFGVLAIAGLAATWGHPALEG